MIALIDYDAGNMKSVEKALLHLGQEVIITREKETLKNADKVILPGVGAFADAMKNLDKYGLIPVIKEVISMGKPFLGICLGLQLLFEGSDEGEGVEGLGVLPGRILKIPEKEGFKVPHMGWNSLSFPKESTIMKQLPSEPYVYFVHSYYLKASDESIVTAATDYITTIHAAVERDNVYACQFHPEKSSHVGLQILKNFAELEKEGK